jgi:hypothetical protein
MKLAIIGSRDFTDYSLLSFELEPYKSKITQVISGGARGADKLGERWAIQNKIPTQIFYADWDNLGKRAGFIRNEDIIKNCDIVIAFWDGKSNGTKHSLSLCEKYNKPKKIIIYE